MSTGTLMTHCGAHEVSRNELISVEAPQCTDTWFPIRHYEVLEATENTLASAGFRSRTSSLAVSHDDKRFFGVLDIESQLVDGVNLSIGLRNSNDKSFPIGFCVGIRTFVCDDLAFSSEIVISKKHTRFGKNRFREGIADAVNRLRDYETIEAERICKMQQTEITDCQAEAVILRAWEQCIVGTRLLKPLLKEWREPSFEEFRDRTAFALLSAYTHVVKDRQKKYPSKAAFETMEFQGLLAV